MARQHRDNLTNDDGVQDSFLDIVANIVGILILLVIVVGIRAAMAPKLAASDATDAELAPPVLTRAIVEDRAKSIAGDAREVSELYHRVVDLKAEAQARDAIRLDLTMYTAEVERELELKKQELDESKAERLEVRSQLAKADLDWDRLMRQKVGLAAKTAAAVESVYHTPTPLVRNHADHTLHLRLEHGRVAIVPFEELVSQLDSRPVDTLRRDLERQGGVSRLDPIGGFELHFALITFSSDAGPMGVRQMGTFLTGEVRPLSDEVGEPIDEALDDNSRLSSALKQANPHDTIVMMWTYPDSTSAYRHLQNEIRKRGYAVDLRLLSETSHISFSPDGRKTAAQ